jgi:hypothetical protein
VRHGAAGFGSLVVLFMFLVVLEPLPVHAVTIIGTDPTVGTAKCPTSGSCGSTLSWTHTVGSNPNRILIVGISAVPVSASVSVTLVQFGSSSLTPLTPIITGSYLVQQWYLLNPSGSAMVTVTFTSSPAFAVGASASFFNVAGVGASNGATGTSTTASVTVSAISGDLVVDTLATEVGLYGASPDGSQTPLWNLNIGEVLGAGSDKPASSPVTMQWTFGSLTLSWALVAVDLQPATVGGYVVPIDRAALLAPWIASIVMITVSLVAAGMFARKLITKHN